MGDLGRGLLLQAASRPGLDQLGPICILLPGPRASGVNGGWTSRGTEPRDLMLRTVSSPPEEVRSVVKGLERPSHRCDLCRKLKGNRHRTSFPCFRYREAHTQ